MKISKVTDYAALNIILFNNANNTGTDISVKACMFVYLIDLSLYVPVNNVSVMSGRALLG